MALILVQVSLAEEWALLFHDREKAVYIGTETLTLTKNQLSFWTLMRPVEGSQRLSGIGQLKQLQEITIDRTRRTVYATGHDEHGRSSYEKNTPNADFSPIVPDTTEDLIWKLTFGLPDMTLDFYREGFRDLDQHVRETMGAPNLLYKKNESLYNE